MKSRKDRDMNAWADCLLDMCMDERKWVDKYRENSVIENNRMVIVT
jgi:hypothetical protein